jgi:hypothetical protein
LKTQEISVRLVLIGYDLHRRSRRDYNRLIESIKALGACLHNLDSTWFVATPLSVTEIRDALVAHFNPLDTLVVVDLVSMEWAGSGLNPFDAAWLDDQL